MTQVKDESTVVTPAAMSQEDSSRSAGADPAPGASLDKVRDLLFGVQVREFERRFVRLEERLVKETNELKEDVKRRLDALESYARQESEALAAQIRSEQAARADAAQDLARELKETANSFARRTTTLDEQLSKSQRESRQQMLEQHQRLSEDIRTKVDDVLATLAREAQELRSGKTDRAVLAALLNEMAMRLTNGLTIPDDEVGDA